MYRETFKIGVMAPGSRIDMATAERVKKLAAAFRCDRTIDLQFHPQCFSESGHFAGNDDARRAAFVEIANDDSVDALWFARGGHGTCRIARAAVAQLAPVARRKIYLGYSDAGFLLAALFRAGFTRLAHGPMPSDITRQGGDVAVKRSLAYLVASAPDTLEPNISPDTRTAAFNMAVLSHMLGTPLQPDLMGHVLMLEEVAEYMYRIDRFLFHITSNPGVRQVSGIMLGRCNAILPNNPNFNQSAEELIRHWCAFSGIPYLGRADIGHDINNKIVPLGRYQSVEAPEVLSRETSRRGP